MNKITTFAVIQNTERLAIYIEENFDAGEQPYPHPTHGLYISKEKAWSPGHAQLPRLSEAIAKEVVAEAYYSDRDLLEVAKMYESWDLKG